MRSRDYRMSLSCSISCISYGTWYIHSARDCAAHFERGVHRGLLDYSFSGDLRERDSTIQLVVGILIFSQCDTSQEALMVNEAFQGDSPHTSWITPVYRSGEELHPRDG